MTFNLQEIILDKKEAVKKLVSGGISEEEAYLKVGIDKHFKIFDFLHKVGHASIHTAVEVGVSYPWSCQFRDEILRTNTDINLVESGWRVNDGTYVPTHFSLIDVRPEICQALNHCFGAFKNVSIHNFGISDETGVKTMVWKDGSTYEKGIDSPYVQKIEDAEHSVEFKFQCFSFGEIDNGDIQILSADIEGNEYFILKTMKSRPLAITLELSSPPISTNARHYMNPFINEISQWMNDNDYIPFNFSVSDVTFLKSDFYDKLNNLGRI